MPPKNQPLNPEDIPKIQYLIVTLSLPLSQSTLQAYQTHLSESLTAHQDYLELVTKARLRTVALEKGLIYDPEALTDKQKKDAKFMAQVQNSPTEMSAEIYFKCFQSILQDMTAQKTDPKFLQQKQNQKKDPKKDAKQEEQAEVKPLKQFDHGYVLLNYPENLEEYEFFQKEEPIIPNVCVFTKEQSQVKQIPDFMKTLNKTKDLLEKNLTIDIDNDFEIFDEQQNANQSQEDFQDTIKVIDTIKHQRAISSTDDEIRKTVFANYNLQIYNDNSDAERIQTLVKNHMDAFFKYTHDVSEYTNFHENANKKHIPVYKKEDDPQYPHYAKQLSNLEESQFSTSVYLEGILDQVAENTLPLHTKKSLQEIFDLYDQLTLNQKQEKPDQASPLHCELDLNSQLSLNSSFFNGEKILDRVNHLHKRMPFPGLDRHQIPEQSDWQNYQRASKQHKIKCVIQLDYPIFLHYRSLTLFEKMLKDFQPKRSFDLSQRVYSEVMDEMTLRQALFKAFMQDSTRLTFYDEEYDALYLAVVYKNPPGRILRKQWKYKDRILPDFQNFFTQFQNKTEEKGPNNWYYDADYLNLGNIQEKSKYFYPNDQSVIYSKRQKFGDNLQEICGVLAESYSLTMGPDLTYIDLKLNHNKVLVDYKPLLNDQDEQVDGKQHAFSVELTTKNGLIVKFLSNGDVMQTIQKSQNKMKRAFSDIVGPYDSQPSLSTVEHHRLITKDGHIVRVMKDGQKSIFMSNGNIVQKQNQWVYTLKSNGEQYRRSTNMQLEKMHALKVKEYFDIETQSLVTVREDKTTIIEYQDKSRLIIFPDGTKHHTVGDIMTVSHSDFATVKVRLDKTKQRVGTIIGQGSAFASVGQEDIMMRSFDGYVSEIFMPDGGHMYSYLEKRETEVFQQYIMTQVFVMEFQDGSSMKVDSTEMVLIGGNDRHNFQDPNEYFLQLFTVPQERKQGVYTNNFAQKKCYTQDSEGNMFEMYQDGSVKSKIAVSFDMDDQPKSPEYSEDEYVDIVNQYLPLSTTTIEPQFFIINKNNTGRQIFSEAQLKNYFRLKKQDDNTTIKIQEGQNCIQNYQIMTKKKLACQVDQDYKIPRVVNNITKTGLPITSPEVQHYTYRNFQKYGPFDTIAREKIHNDLESINNHNRKLTQSRDNNKIEGQPLDKQEQEDIIQMKIYASS